jgi:hypothetical protein
MARASTEARIAPWVSPPWKRGLHTLSAKAGETDRPMKAATAAADRQIRFDTAILRFRRLRFQSQDSVPPAFRKFGSGDAGTSR